MKRFILLAMIGISVFQTVKSQELKPTDTEALVLVNVTNFKLAPIPQAKVIFKSKTTKKEYSVVTDRQGKAKLLMPKGDSYQIQYKDFIKRADYSVFEMPNQEGHLTMTINIKYQPSTVITLNNVYFDTDKSTIKPNSYKQLNDMVTLMKERPDLKIEIDGHTDNQGGDAHNMTLSKDRANAVKAYLVKHGITAGRIITKGFGSLHPVADNATASGRAQNRRIEVRVLENK